MLNECMQASMSLSEWRGATTRFDGFYKTQPMDEIQGKTWQEICETLAPTDGPVLVGTKENATYFVPCLLSPAPFVGSTLAKAIEAGRSTVGKQRSATHVTAAWFLTFDLDGLKKEQFQATCHALDRFGLTYLAYSSWSHGRGDKPGIRARLLVPVDVALDTIRYAKAWHAADDLFFNGLADPTGAKLCQQQGVWCTHPDRVNLAFQKENSGSVLSVSALPLHAQSTQAASSVQKTAGADEIDMLPDYCAGPTPALERIVAAVPWLDPNNYAEWISNIKCMSALAPVIGEAAMRVLAATYSEAAEQTAKARNANSSTNPDAIFDRGSTLSVPVAAATLFAHARDNAVRIVAAEAGMPSWSTPGGAAALYIATYHPRSWEQLKGRHEQVS